MQQSQELLIKVLNHPSTAGAEGVPICGICNHSYDSYDADYKLVDEEGNTLAHATSDDNRNYKR